MSAITKSPSYLIRNQYSYCFRMRIPNDLQTIIGKKELRYSLKTGYVSTAKSKAGLLAGNIKRLFFVLRRRDKQMSKLSRPQIQEMINKYIRNELDSYEDERATIGVMHPDELVETQEGLKEYIAYLYMHLQDSYCGSDDIVKKIFAENGFQFDEDSDEFRILCRELEKALIKMTEVDINRNWAKYTDNVEELFPLRSDSQSPTKFEAQPAVESKRLSEIIEAYSKENKIAGNWTPRTETEYSSIFKNILILLENPYVNMIDHSIAQQFKADLMVLPKNYFKATTKYKDIPISQFHETKAEETLSPKTINKYITNLNALLNHAVKNGYMESNPAQGIKIKVKSDPQEERDPFSDSDLKTIFYSAEYKEDTFNTPWKFWLPILGLYTGCRIEELCRLTIDNIREIDDFWVIDITSGNSTGNRVKTGSSRRVIPLHPLITVDLNFIGYVNNLPQEDHIRLFPDLSEQSDRYGHYPSRWFGIFKRKYGIDSPKKVFHSFRHNIQNCLKQQSIAEPFIAELSGHVVPGETMGRYGKRFEPSVLYKEAVLKINYDLDLSHLKKSKYVIKK